MEEVFKRLKQCNIVIKPNKCKLIREEIVYLGHVVGNGVVKLDPENLKAIQNVSFSTTLREVRSFTMLASYYRRFVENFAEIATLLTDNMD